MNTPMKQRRKKKVDLLSGKLNIFPQEIFLFYLRTHHASGQVEDWQQKNVFGSLQGSQKTDLLVWKWEKG